jgi:SAM-dependent methyltransferase
MSLKGTVLQVLVKMLCIPLQLINRWKYVRQSAFPNERAVEYGFVFGQIAQKAPGRVLDVGTGITALPALIRNCGVNVTAIDNVRDYWPIGMFNQHWFVLDRDILEPDWGGEKFDVITCISVLEHIKDYNKAVSQMSMLLNKGGILVLSFPYCEKQYVENVYVRELSDAFGRSIPFVCQVYSRDQIDHWVKNFGLSIVSQEYWQFYKGEFWSEGAQVFPPIKTEKYQSHQITCLALVKS